MSELCQSLEAEHRVIEGVLNALEAESQKIENGGPVMFEFFEQAIAFIRQYADGLHHQKEESILFPRMESAGVPREGGPIGVMLAEHLQGRQIVRTMEDSLSAATKGLPEARYRLIEAARDYVALLRDHIEKEDSVLFPMADRVFGDNEKNLIRSEFRNAESTHREVSDKQRHWAETISKT